MSWVDVRARRIRYVTSGPEDASTVARRMLVGWRPEPHPQVARPTPL
ncbi:MAG TPA: hypothetical protein VFG35_31950 [Actinoplanes sp.]|nr:hypothetical protein [Actinoplanes sp.]